MCNRGRKEPIGTVGTFWSKGIKLQPYVWDQVGSSVRGHKKPKCQANFISHTNRRFNIQIKLLNEKVIETVLQL